MTTEQLAAVAVEQLTNAPAASPSDTQLMERLGFKPGSLHAKVAADLLRGEHVTALDVESRYGRRVQMSHVTDALERNGIRTAKQRVRHPLRGTDPNKSYGRDPVAYWVLADGEEAPEVVEPDDAAAVRSRFLAGETVFTDDAGLSSSAFAGLRKRMAKDGAHFDKVTAPKPDGGYGYRQGYKLTTKRAAKRKADAAKSKTPAKATTEAVADAVLTTPKASGPLPGVPVPAFLSGLTVTGLLQTDDGGTTVFLRNGNGTYVAEIVGYRAPAPVADA